jgi:hypothetical protein
VRSHTSLTASLARLVHGPLVDLMAERPADCG